ncbi:unnamed protein product [Vitrella brassicaformis CCMP3155]|uniref:Major facilitator superfamily (MFS) profile domain-containing protein n=2 Tax=Vitrella brassicaformis TaxID=1169539 RepID=A0A0G4FAK0_VITBC|nr:unnamed protein product [Vitrella brassicaformis CCMP3155]|eukprot:CEM09947.1 unnamed protein product [Vitrella brassicaformis CCMP3155]
MEAIIEAIGSYGAFQRGFSWVIDTPPWILVGAQAISLVFMAEEPPRICHNPSNDPAGCRHGEILEQTDCAHTFTYGSEDRSTVVSEWDLGYCSRRGSVFYDAQMASSAFFLGFLIGVLAIGYLADHLGRKPAYIVSLAFVTFCGVGSAVARSFVAYVVLRAGTGIGIGGLGLSVYILNSEVVCADKRLFITILTHCGFAVGGCLVAVMSYFILSWRWLTLAVSLPGFLLALLLLCPLFVESPRWAAATKRYAKAYDALCTMARINGTSLPPHVSPASLPSLLNNTRGSSIRRSSSTTTTIAHATTASSLGEPSSTHPTRPSGRESSVWSLLTVQPVAERLYVSLLTWFATSMAYYGLSLSAGRIGPTSQITTFINGACEVPAVILGVKAVAWRRLGGRKGVVNGSLLLGGLLCLGCAMLAGPGGWGLMVVALLGRFSVSMTFAGIYLYAAEMFPASLRSTATGMMSTAARVAGIAAPQVISLGVASPGLPSLIFGLTATIAGVTGFIGLPDTLGKPFYDTLHDMHCDMNIPAHRSAAKPPRKVSEGTAMSEGSKTADDAQADQLPPCDIRVIGRSSWYAAINKGMEQQQGGEVKGVDARDTQALAGSASAV